MTLRVERGCGTCARYFLFPPAVARNKNLFGLPLTHPLLEGHGSLTYCDFFARNLNYASAIMPDHLLDQSDSKQTIAQYNKKNSRHSESVATNHCGREMIWKSFCPGLGQALTMAEILGIKCEERLLQRTDVETLIVIVYTRSYNFGCKQ